MVFACSLTACVSSTVECKSRVSRLVDFVLNLANCSEDPSRNCHRLGLEVTTEEKLGR